MARRLRQAPTIRILILLASIVILLAGLKEARGFFVPVLLASFLATVSLPITNWLDQHRFPRWLAVTLTLLINFAFLVGVVLIGISLINEFVVMWNLKYREQLLSSCQSGLVWLQHTLENVGVEDAEEKVGVLGEGLPDFIGNLEIGEVASGAEWVFSLGTNVVGSLATFFLSMLLIVIMTVVMLSESKTYHSRLKAIFDARGPDFEKITRATKDIQKFLGIKTVVSVLTGLSAGLLCFFAGVDFPVLWGIVAYAFNYIPVVGSIIAGVFPTLLALLAGWPTALVVAIGYFVINTIFGNVIEPYLLGKRLGLSTLVVILAVLFWGWLWGAFGMLLAVPLTMVLKVILDNSYEFRWISVAMSKEKRREKFQKNEPVEEVS